MRDYFNKGAPVRFIFPIDGDCLNIYDGTVKDGYLTIPVKVEAPAEADIYIDERKARYDGTCFVAEVPLKSYRTSITARDHISGYETTIAVFKLEDCVGRYRISLDDNILFLADLTEHQDEYTSLFDNPYLQVFKKAHDLYGAKVHINIYYEYMDEEPDRKSFSGRHDYFNLTMMTDKYKAEWEANADWLKLSFHARANSPGRPYEFTTMERLDTDIALVHREIIRFAGLSSLSPVTTLHFGAVNKGGLRVLRNRGYRGLNAFFTLNEAGKPVVSYGYPKELVEYLDNRDFWVDTVENIVFSKVNRVINKYTSKEIEKELELVCSECHKSGFVELLMHEQYFYPDFRNHMPDFEEMILTCARWLTEHGYKGSLFSEVMFEK